MTRAWPYMWGLTSILVVLLTIQIWWTYELTTSYNEKTLQILSNQVKIMTQYEGLKGIGQTVIEQNNNTTAALNGLADNDKEIVDKCLKSLDEYLKHPQGTVR